MRIDELCSNQPRYALSMDLTDGFFEIGANCHYTIDTPIIEALNDFLKYCREHHNEFTQKDNSCVEIDIYDVFIKDKKLYMPT
ncbi:MAG: hypothetical protein GY861_25800 [bacterium]|nr:hypothetical protein [bacterium]